MNWVVAIADALLLEQPVFMGCSVGGQLALDLAAAHGRRFAAFVSLNGWYDKPPAYDAFDNNIFRTPSVSEDYPMSLILGGTAPQAPEAFAQEVYWIYRSNFPGIYAGDNDYFMNEHDLKINGHLIDAQATPAREECPGYLSPRTSSANDDQNPPAWSRQSHSHGSSAPRSGGRYAPV
jgi:pimeloyl-ACP methyl ester carboxylesterase